MRRGRSGADTASLGVGEGGREPSVGHPTATAPSLRRAPAGRARSRTWPEARAAPAPGPPPPGFPGRFGPPSAPRSRRSTARTGGSPDRPVSASPPPAGRRGEGEVGSGLITPRVCSPSGQFCTPQLGAQDAVWQADQLSSQLYRNKQVEFTKQTPRSSNPSSLYHRAIAIKLQSQHLFISISIPQLQDTLLQKEEELARLHEENNNLRQYLNSALIKCLEEKAKKLLSCHGQKNCATLKNTKRRLKEDRCFVPLDTPHASKARRNLFNEFTACEEQPSPAVDSWVLQTLGLKDVNTIDETSANYSALSSDLGKDTYCLSAGESADYDHTEGTAATFTCSHVPPANSSTYPQSEDSSFLPQFSSAPCVSSAPSLSSLPAPGLPYLTGDFSPNKTEVAFTTSLSPHRNVRTHTFHQGQAFVCRGDDGGWRFTWVPKQAE
ncbi:geminin coiled-coil domain-containing protein 1 [Heliangelus exortis]|uniref:geminin coiled-coil domain-containing protein 1 n=1 Tax=Heliangelus exortis TaxID=472823 RepID=UPI003A90EE15